MSIALVAIDTRAWLPFVEKFSTFSLLLILILLTACGNTPIRDSYELVPTIAITIPTAAPTQEPGDPTGTALAFYRAWENEDYEGMYSLLSDGSRRLIGIADFVSIYADAMTEARVNKVTTQPLAAQRSDERTAEMTMRVSWETAVTGTLVREHTVPLVWESGRWAIVWAQTLLLPEMADGGTLKLTTTAPSRAPLHDRGDMKLSFQGNGVTIGVVPSKLEDEAAFLQAISTLLGRTPEAIQAIYADLPPEWYIPLGLLPAGKLEENYDLVQPFFGKGLVNNQRVVRMTNGEKIAPHLLGQVGEISPERWPDFEAQGYRRDEKVGLNGLELAAEPFLNGKRGGKLSLISALGEEVRVIAEVDVQPGRVVHTTFDSAFQLQVQQTLEEAITTHGVGSAGAIVVLDVNSGAIRAMASYPTFDPDVFNPLRTDSSDIITSLLNSPSRPLVNRAIQSAYPPGSTFKIVTMSAGLHSEKFKAQTPYACSGAWYRLQPRVFEDWKEEGHGTVTLVEALTQSCNTYSYEIGYTLGQDDPYFMADMARSFGLGDVSALQLAELPGVMPDPDWKRQAFGEGWGPGDAVNMAIGQGFTTATPLQIANMTAAIANGGTVYHPNIIDRIEGNQYAPEQIIQPVVMSELPLSAEHVTAIQQGLNDVTSGGWGTAVDKMRGLPVTTAGKTGTAEVAGENTEPHSWFTGYAPFEEPEIAIAIIIENAGEGSAIAAPVFRRIIEQYYAIDSTPFPWQIEKETENELEQSGE